MAEEKDGQLAELAQRGSRQAFGKLADRYRGTIFNLAYRMLGNRDDAEDVAQTVFVKAFQSLGSFRLGQKFFSWIYRIAINESISFVEKRKNRVELGRDLAWNGHSPEEAYHLAEMADKVQDALMDMEVSSRVLVVLRHFADLSYHDLSFVFEIPEKTIKSRLYDARRSLSKILVRHGIAEPL